MLNYSIDSRLTDILPVTPYRPAMHGASRPMTQGQPEATEAAASKHLMANQSRETMLGLWVQLSARDIIIPGLRIGCPSATDA